MLEQLLMPGGSQEGGHADVEAELLFFPDRVDDVKEELQSLFCHIGGWGLV